LVRPWREAAPIIIITIRQQVMPERTPLTLRTLFKECMNIMKITINMRREELLLRNLL
jgi:hypothetical protein